MVRELPGWPGSADVSLNLLAMCTVFLTRSTQNLIKSVRSNQI